MRGISKIAIVLVALALAVGMVACKQATTVDTQATNATPSLNGITVFGTVGGRIVGPTGQPLGGIPVTATTGGSSRAIVATTTDGNGLFEIQRLTSGTHSIFLGNGVSSTTRVVSVAVPDLAALKTAAQFNSVTVTNLAGETVPQASLLSQNDGPYFVKIPLNTGAGAVDQFTLYPCNATITGRALIKKVGDLSNSNASPAPAGTKVIADFTGWNNSKTLIFTTTVSDGTTGAFTLSNIPAVFGLGSGSIGFSIVSEATASGVNSYAIDGSTSNTDSSGTYIDDGAILPGDSRDIGSLVFVAGLKPKIVTYSPTNASVIEPGTSTPTALEFTFDQQMKTTKGSFTVTSTMTDSSPADISTNFTAAWNAAGVPTAATLAGTILRLTPSHSFESDTTIDVALTNYESAAGVSFNTSSGDISYTVRPAFALLASNLPPYSNATQEFPVSGTNISLTFNYPVATIDWSSAGTYLEEVSTSDQIYFDTTTSGTGLPANSFSLVLPAGVTLKNAVSYTLHYAVKATLTQGEEAASGTVTFTTAPRSITLAGPTISFDVARDYILHGGRNSANFNNGDGQFFIQYSKVTNGEQYYLQYKWSTDVAWITYATALKDTIANTSATYETSSACSSSISMASLATGYTAVAAGKSMDLRIQVKASTGLTTPLEAYSSTSLSLADQIAPTVNTLTLTASLVSGDPNNTSGNSPYAVYNITTNTTEPLQTPVAADVTPPTNATVSSIGLIGPHTIEIVFAIASTTNPTGSAVTISVYDAAGNQYDNNVGTAGNQPFSFNL